MSTPYDGMGLIDLLDQLEEIPDPALVPLTPQTPGWLVLGLVLAAILGFALRQVLHHHRANAYRREALARIETAGDDPAAIAAILRRTALTAFPRAQVAGLSGAGWLAFLDATFPGAGFAEGPGRAIATAPYRKAPADPADPALRALARDWIRRHRRDGGNR